jgi:hypothetical protein
MLLWKYIRIYCPQHASHIASDPLKQIQADLICQESWYAYIAHFSQLRRKASDYGLYFEQSPENIINTSKKQLDIYKIIYKNRETCKEVIYEENFCIIIMFIIWLYHS